MISRDARDIAKPLDNELERSLSFVASTTINRANSFRLNLKVELACTVI